MSFSKQNAYRTALIFQRIAEDEPEKLAIKANGLFFQEKEKRLSESKYSALAESHVPCFQERVGTRHPRYMIPDRLPWRLRARPSATLHEIQVRSEERTCSPDGIEPSDPTSRGNSFTTKDTKEILGSLASLCGGNVA